MSQFSGGSGLDRASSISVNITQSPAAAFGDDIADDSYSVSELSHYDEDRRMRKLGKSKKQAETFGRSKLSHYSRKDSYYPDQTGEVENGADNDSKKQRGSSGSHSDEQRTMSSESEDADIPVTTFASFAKTKFQMKIPHTYSGSALPQPLLPKANRSDYLAALASWVTIQRIMGDLPDVDTGDALVVAGTGTPITSKVKASFKAKYTKKDIEDAHKKYSDLFKDPVGTDASTIPFLTGKAETMLDKVQMICAIGIYKPALRDELYCQLCKQLTNNPSRNSTVRGWVLLSLFAGSFTPSEKFAPSLTNFLKEGPSEFSEKVDRLYRRTCSVGTRSYPPSWLEFQAAKNSKPLLVPVTFMSGHRMLCEVDAAMTVLEVIRNVSERIGLQEFTGYSLYVSLHTKISCLGHGQHRILDAISECEQYTKQLGLRESNSIWRLFFRREYFTSWYIPGEDPVCTDLVYQQIKRGITMGEYRFDKEEPMMEHAAKIYYIEYPDDVEFKEIAPFLSSFISENVLDKRPKNYYTEKLRQTFDELKLGKDRPDPLQVKKEIIAYAMDKFYILFARYYDASKVTGPSMQIMEVVVGVNNKGIYVVDDEDKLRLHVDFCEIVDVSKSKHHVTLGIANMEDFVFQTNHSDDFYAMVTSVLEELKKRSTLAIAKQDFTQLDGPPDSTIIKGDILELSQSMADLGNGDVVTVLNKRTNKPCDVLTSLLYMVPTVTPLDDAMMQRLTAQIRKNVASVMTGDHKVQHTLEEYSKYHFRAISESAVTKFFSKASIKKKDSECLWAYSKDALKKPLLKRTCNREDIRQLACHCFTSIQTYMSNLSINDEASNYHLCNEWILNPARRNKYLRDEIYCQIIKQLTKNPDRSNEERGWVLLTLLTSMTPPTNELQEHTFQFLYGSTHPLARECEKNLKFKRRRGGTRLYTSHYLEHEMVTRQQPNIRIQVILPSKVTQTLEVTSHTRIFDLKKEVARRLNLRTFHEYSLFLTSKDRVHCLSDRALYFDCLSHSEVYWFGGGRRNSQASYRSPSLVMLKKIWVNGQPGIDAVADQIFHFSQEIPNYLRGYHHIPDEKIPKLTALAYRAQYDSDETNFTKLKDIAPLIFPRGYLDGKDMAAIQQVVYKEYAAGWAMSQQQAKTAFLQELSSLSTYGSVFFEVKQRHVKSLPKYCQVAINYSGVHVVDAKTKSIIKSFRFESLPNWAYDDMSFTLIVAENNNTSKLLFETNVGHNMDDLLMSYVAWIMNYQMRKKHGFLGDTSGESIC